MEQHDLTIRETADRYRMQQGRETTRPQIRLQGNWLANAGFEPGMRARVNVKDGCLIIFPYDPEKGDAE